MLRHLPPRRAQVGHTFDEPTLCKRHVQHGAEGAQRDEDGEDLLSGPAEDFLEEVRSDGHACLANFILCEGSG